MRLPTARNPAFAIGLVQALIVAISLAALAACSTTRPSPATPEDDSSSRPVPVAAEPESREDSERQPMPEKSPARTDPTPAAPSTQPDRPAASDERSEPTEAEVEGESNRAPVAAAPPPTAADPDPSPEPQPALTLSGRVRLNVSQVEDVDDDSIRDTVVYFRPAGAPIAAEPRNFEITTRRKRLMPDVLVIPVGSTVAFPNEDDILHNVFSVSSAANFDLGLYGEGESKSHTFLESGLAVIHCNVHHAMRADVLVVDTPFFTRADPDGRFSIDGIQAMEGELVAWHPRAGFSRRQTGLPLTEPVEIELTLTRPRIPDHLDKTGKPYRPERPSRR